MGREKVSDIYPPTSLSVSLVERGLHPPPKATIPVQWPSSTPAATALSG